MGKSNILFLALLLFGFTTAAQIDASFKLWMWTTGKHTFWDGKSVENYGFTIGIGSPRIPGPVLRVTEGDSVQLIVRNQSQGAPHSVHLHGLDVNQANDGVPSTSWDIKHKETKGFKFKADKPGTYLYHCHVATVLHVQFGMYGSLIVEPKSKGSLAAGYNYNRDFNLLFSEADKSWFDNKPKHATGDSVHAKFHIPKYEPDYFMVNGNGKQLIDTLVMRPDENVLIRLSAVGYFQNLVRFPGGVTATLVTSDGRVLPNKPIIDSLYLTPGERYGVLLSPIGKSSDNIIVEYQDMNTGKSKASELIPFTWDATLSLANSQSKNELSVFPNPARENLNISFPNYSDIRSFTIINNQGLTIMEQVVTNFSSSIIQVDVSQFSSGVYTVILNSNEEGKISRSFVVE